MIRLSLKTLAMWLVVIGGLNWLLVGLIKLDVVAAIFGGMDSMLARLVYILIGLSALWVLVDMLGMTGGKSKR